MLAEVLKGHRVAEVADRIHFTVAYDYIRRFNESEFATFEQVPDLSYAFRLLRACSPGKRLFAIMEPAQHPRSPALPCLAAPARDSTRVHNHGGLAPQSN